jgi:formylglycine-generating enzyme required for sulfatase activity
MLFSSVTALAAPDDEQSCLAFQDFHVGPVEGVVQEILSQTGPGHVDEASLKLANGREVWVLDGDSLLEKEGLGKQVFFEYDVSTLWIAEDKWCFQHNKLTTVKPMPQQSATSSPYGTTTVTNSIGMEFALIPAGSFGRSFVSKNQFGEEVKTSSRVVVSKPFGLGKYEVTQEQWVAVMGSNPSEFPGRRNPVENISWLEAKEFTLRLNCMEGAMRYRLPTEAEWEYAARGGRDTRFFFMQDMPGWVDNNLNTSAGMLPILNHFTWFRYENRDTGDKYPTSPQPVGQKEIGRAHVLNSSHGY